MYLTVRQQPKLGRYEYDTLLELCRYAKNLYNEGLYNTMIIQRIMCFPLQE